MLAKTNININTNSNNNNKSQNHLFKKNFAFVVFVLLLKDNFVCVKPTKHLKYDLKTKTNLKF